MELRVNKRQQINKETKKSDPFGKTRGGGAEEEIWVFERRRHSSPLLAGGVHRCGFR